MILIISQKILLLKKITVKYSNFVVFFYLYYFIVRITSKVKKYFVLLMFLCATFNRKLSQNCIIFPVYSEAYYTSFSLLLSVDFISAWKKKKRLIRIGAHIWQCTKFAGAYSDTRIQGIYTNGRIS